MTIITFAAFVLAFVVALLFVPIAKQIATRAKIVDQPDKKRKLHGRIVPLTGGITVMFGLTLVIALTVCFADSVRTSIIEGWMSLLGLGLGASLLFIVGIADDRWGVRGRQKLVGQIASAALVLGGFLLQVYVRADGHLVLFEGAIPTIFAVGLLFIVLIGSINAVNLIDGADGLASTVGTIGSTAVFFMFLMTGNLGWEAVMAIALAGTLLGFLFYNFPPATTFLGDSGSMLIGLILGALAIESCYDKQAGIALCAPVAIVAIPFFDSFIAILRRRLTGRSIYTVDRGHLHHTLLERGLGPRGMLAVVAGLCAISALGGILSIQFASEYYAIGSIGLVLGGLVVGRIFGFVEFQLLAQRLYGVSRSFLIPPARLRETPHQQRVRLQGSRNWDFLWEAITEFAEEHELSEVRLDLNLPWLHEGYHAVWHRRVDAEAHECWHTRLPLTGNGQTFGRLEISGPLSQNSVYSLLGVLAELLESMETVIVRLAERPETATPSVEEKVIEAPVQTYEEEKMAFEDDDEPSGINSGSDIIAQF